MQKREGHNLLCWMMMMIVRLRGKGLYTCMHGPWARMSQQWDVATGAVLQTLGGYMNHVDSIAFSHDDKLVFAVFADYLKVWELPTGGAALNTLYLGRRFR